MKHLTILLAILTIIEFMTILMLYFRVIRMTAEIVYQQEQITDLQMDLHSVLNDRDMICD